MEIRSTPSAHASGIAATHALAAHNESVGAAPTAYSHRAAHLHAQDLINRSIRSTQVKLAVLADTFATLNQENQEIIEDVLPSLLKRIADTRPENSLTDDLTDDIIALIKRTQQEWIERYANILKNYINLFDKITTALNKLKDSITGHDDKGNFKVDFSSVLKELRGITDLGIGGDFTSKANADAFLKELGVDWLEVSDVGGGRYELKLKGKFMEDLIGAFSKAGTMTPTEYNSIITAKDNIMERLMHMNKVIPDKHQRKLQLWDSLVKTLSSTFESIAEANKAIVANTSS